jgi:hypothetical protein
MSEAHWQFSGIVVSLEPKTTGKGKPFSELVINRPDAKYPEICVCTFWGKLPDGVDRGVKVDASGYMAGREYNGKFYAGLRVTLIKPIVAATPQKRQDDQAAGAPQESEQEMPF